MSVLLRMAAETSLSSCLGAGTPSLCVQRLRGGRQGGRAPQESAKGLGLLSHELQDTAATVQASCPHGPGLESPYVVSSTAA